jgi:hypothetical protein
MASTGVQNISSARIYHSNARGHKLLKKVTNFGRHIFCLYFFKNKQDILGGYKVTKCPYIRYLLYTQLFYACAFLHAGH